MDTAGDFPSHSRRKPAARAALAPQAAGWCILLDPETGGRGDRFRAGVHAELRVHVLETLADGVGRDAEHPSAR